LAHGGVAVPGAGGLDQNYIEAVARQELDQKRQVLGDGAAPGKCGEAADEDAVVGLARHAETVAEQSAAAERALRIAREHRDLQILRTEMLDQLANKRALADAAAASDGDDTRGLGRGGEL